MNNVIILGKVISKSSIHFDYLDKLKAYFEIKVIECGNIFSVNISEKYLGVVLVGELYSNLCVDDIVCVYGSVLNNNYIVCNEIYIL